MFFPNRDREERDRFPRVEYPKDTKELAGSLLPVIFGAMNDLASSKREKPNSDTESLIEILSGVKVNKDIYVFLLPAVQSQTGKDYVDFNDDFNRDYRRAISRVVAADVFRGWPQANNEMEFARHFLEQICKSCGSVVREEIEYGRVYSPRELIRLRPDLARVHRRDWKKLTGIEVILTTDNVIGHGPGGTFEEVMPYYKTQ